MCVCRADVNLSSTVCVQEVGRRSARNQCLQLLAARKSCSLESFSWEQEHRAAAAAKATVDLACDQYFQSAACMTDTVAALKALLAV